MVDALPLTDAIRAISGELLVEPYSPTRLNQIAVRIDQMGRRLHGLDWVRAHEIGACLTAAVTELSLAGGQPEVERAASVRGVIVQLDAALAYTDDGLYPDQAAPVTERPAAKLPI